MNKRGFIDLQVNGILGIDFSGPIEKQDVVRAYETLQTRGTETFLPTIITNPFSVYERNLPLLADVIENADPRHAIAGIHLEGPFISAEPGAVGAHAPEHIRSPDIDEFKKLQELAGGHIRMLTVAPECKGAAALINYAVQHGVAVSLGHSLYTPDDLAMAADNGAGALTHFGNGIPNMLPRHNNPLWAGLANPHFSIMLITDSHHLPSFFIEAVVRAKGAEKVIVVSDASPVAGMEPGNYRVLGNDAVLEPSGKLHNSKKECLVGSSATMKECMDFMESLGFLSSIELEKVGRDNALKLIGLS